MAGAGTGPSGAVLNIVPPTTDKLRRVALDVGRRTSAPVVGVSPMVAGAVVDGMAAACLQAIGVDTAAQGVAAHCGARAGAERIDGWLVHEGDESRAPGVVIRAAPLLMIDPDETTAMAARAVELTRGVA